eukprot:7280053-Ditylum_brightwellii.AAC.1
MLLIQNSTAVNPNVFIVIDKGNKKGNKNLSKNVELNGQCTGSGGGGTKFSSVTEATAALMVAVHYLVSTYSTHDIQTLLQNACDHALGEGGQNQDGSY